MSWLPSELDASMRFWLIMAIIGIASCTCAFGWIVLAAIEHLRWVP